MNILGHGIDVVDTARFEKLFKNQHDEYLKRYFTDSELETVSSDETAFSRLAARFAAKEAVMKALRHGFGNGLAFTHIEIKIDADGAPTVALHNKASEISDQLGIRQWWVSISHCGGVAFASAIACG